MVKQYGGLPEWRIIWNYLFSDAKATDEFEAALMCDFLLLNKDNWMDALTPEEFAELEKRYPKTWRNKYNSRNGRYDIIECHADGFYKDHQHGGGQFIIIHVPGLVEEEGKEIVGSVDAFAGLDPEGHPVFEKQYKNKCRLKFSTLPPAIQNAMKNKFVCTVKIADWESFKTNHIGTRGVDI